MDNQHTEWVVQGKIVVSGTGHEIAEAASIGEAEWIAQRLNQAAELEARFAQVGAAYPAQE